MSSHDQILAQAVARNAALVLSLPSAGMLRHHKSRFLREENEALWVQGVPEDLSLVQELIEQQRPVGVALRSGDQKIVFTTVLVRHDPRYPLQAGTVTDGLLLKAPESLKVVQRRSDYRVQMPPDGPLAVRVWRLPEHMKLEQTPTAHQELLGTLHNLSAGGAGVVIEQNQPPRVVHDERLRIELTSSDPSLLEGPLLVEGRVRFLDEQGEPRPWRMGVEFTSLQSDLEGRTTLAALNRLMGRLQRDELRRSRGTPAEAE